MKAIISFLKKSGFKKVPWNNCPQGFEKSNYQCFSHKDKNIWCELYITDAIPYGWIVGNMTTFRGKFFYELKEVKEILIKRTNIN